ncbi:MAG: hypothetical protein AAGH81_06625 [Bacteroidota bacterium]
MEKAWEHSFVKGGVGVIIHLESKLSEVISTEILVSKGCYALLWYKKGKPRSIPRLKEKDKSGILYIGKADKIKSRVGSLQKTILNNSSSILKEPIIQGHQTLSKKFFRIRDNFEIDDFKIKIWNCPDDDPEEVESFLLESYVKQYAELPPLNGQYGKYELDGIDLKCNISIDLLNP